MGGVGSLTCLERMAMCWRVLPPPVLLLLLILAFLHASMTQWTTQLRRSCMADSASALCSSVGSSQGDARVRNQLASFVSTFRDSEASASQLRLNLTATLERYRADVTASSERAARSVGRLSLEYDSLDDRLTTLGAALRNSTQMASIAANSGLLAVKNEMINMSSLAEALKSELNSMKEKMNVSADQLANLCILTGHQTATISQLNQTQHHINAIWSQQDMAVGVLLNSVKSEMLNNMSSLAVTVASELNCANERINTTADELAKLFITTDQQKAAISQLNQTQRHMDDVWKHQASVFGVQLSSLEDGIRRNISSLAVTMSSELHYVNNKVHVTADHLANLFITADHQTAAISHLNETQQLIEAKWSQQASALDIQMNSVKSEMLSNMSSLAVTVASELNCANERINTSADQLAKLFITTDQQKAAISQLNHTQRHMGDAWRQQASALGAQLNSAKSEMARNLSALAGALESIRNFMNDRPNVSASEAAIVISVINQHTTAIGYLNRTQQQSDASWKHQAMALSEELNSTKLDLNRLRDELRLLREDHERLIFHAQNMSAQLRHINECVSNPCVNGQCVDNYNGYECICSPGFSGQTCETDIDECVSNPCVNGQCVDLYNGYNCTCSPGFSGQTCETISGCPNGWTSYSGSCYYVSSTYATWLQAHSGCLSLSSRLIEIESAAENSFVKNNLLGPHGIYSAWIGLTDREVEGEFKWTSGVLLSSSAYSSWRQGEPNHQNSEDCVEFIVQPTPSWNDLPCDSPRYRRRYVCERLQ